MDKDWTYFVQNKGQSEVKISKDTQVKIDVNNNGSFDVLINPNEFIWHQCLIGQKEDCKILIFAKSVETVRDIMKLDDDTNSETILRLQLKGVVKNEPIEPKRHVGKYIDKVGKSVMPIKHEGTTKEEIKVNGSNPTKDIW